MVGYKDPEVAIQMAGEPNLQGMVNETALVKVRPEIDIQVLSFLAESNRLRDYAEARVIKTTEDMKPASDDLNIIRRLRKAMEEKRKEYVKPLQDHTKTINDTFKILMSPVEAADKLTSDKMLAFTAEQDRIRQEQERINTERMKLAQDEMKLTGELTESVNLVEVIPPVATTTRTELGSTGQRDNWQFEVEDFNLLPNEYKIVDAVKLGKVVRAGLRTIPGVRTFNNPSMVSRNK